MIDQELIYRIALTQLPGIGDRRAKLLLSHFGEASAFFSEPTSAIEKIQGIPPQTVQALREGVVIKRAEAEVAFIDEHNVTPLFYRDEDYPNRLKDIDDAPIMLYFKGNADLNPLKAVSIVGTRKATQYGKDVVCKLVEELNAYGVSVISGLAYGIDITAHKAALDNSMETIAVVGHGHDRLYPYQHKTVAAKMLEQGGIITEFLSETKPDRENFPMRNRVIAGMCDATIVVEADVTGGALITARLAASYHREVFALPGRITDPYSSGCHLLIRQHIAGLISSAADIAYDLGWDEPAKSKAPAISLFEGLQEDEANLVRLFQRKGSLPIDEICYNAEIPVSKASGILLNLEFQGIVRSLPGNVYQLAR